MFAVRLYAPMLVWCSHRVWVVVGPRGYIGDLVHGACPGDWAWARGVG